MIIKRKDIQKFLIYGSIVGGVLIAAVLYQTQIKKKDFSEKKP